MQAVITKKRHLNNNNNQIQKASNRSFQVIELYEDEPLVFENWNQNKKKKNNDQTNSISKDKNKDEKRRKLMLVIPKYING